MKKILVAAAVAACMSGAYAAEDINVDVAVIGAGGAGLSAAVEATDLGAKVVVLEKMPMVGGNTIRAAGGLNAAGTALQTAKGGKAFAVKHCRAPLRAGARAARSPRCRPVCSASPSGGARRSCAPGGRRASPPAAHAPRGAA